MAWWVPRLATHGWALALALFVLGLAPLELVRNPVADASANVGVTVPMKPTIDAPTISALSVAAPTDQLRPISSYQAKPGDSVVTVAVAAGIGIDTLLQLNRLSSTALTAGQRLLVPPVDGTLVPIDPNQSLILLAQTFRVDPDVLRRVNDLRPDGKLPSNLFIPAISTAEVAPAPLASPGDPSSGRERVVRFGWPTQGTITQYFWQYHPGIDIANEVGTLEVAADGGTVIWSGWAEPPTAPRCRSMMGWRSPRCCRRGICERGFPRTRNGHRRRCCRSSVMPRWRRSVASRTSPPFVPIAGMPGIHRPNPGSESIAPSPLPAGLCPTAGCVFTWKRAPPSTAASPHRMSSCAAARAPFPYRLRVMRPAWDASPSSGATSIHHKRGLASRPPRPRSPSSPPGT